MREDDNKLADQAAWIKFALCYNRSPAKGSHIPMGIPPPDERLIQ